MGNRAALETDPTRTADPSVGFNLSGALPEMLFCKVCSTATSCAVQVSTSQPIIRQTVDGKEWSSQSLDLRLLPSHYIGGRLTLRCVSTLPGLPDRPLAAELQLGGASVEPVPERGT